MKYLLIISIIFASLQSKSQEFELRDWELLTSFSTPTDATTDSQGNLWVTTTGGVYRYNPIDSTYLSLNKVTGLSDLQYTAILFVEDEGLILCGSSIGSLDIIDTETLEILNVTDLKNFRAAGATIRNLNYHNGIVYVSSSIGLSEFFPKKGGSSIEQIYGDTYQINEIVNSYVFENEIYILNKNEGISKTQVGRIISDPTNWEKMNLHDVTGTSLDSMVFYENDIYVYNTEFIWRINNDSSEIIKERKDYRILKLFEIDNSLKMLTDFSVTDLFSGEEFYDFSFNFRNFYTYNYNNEVKELFFTDIKGIRNYSDEKQAILPNSLGSNLIFDIDTKDDQIWATTGAFGTMHFDGSVWRYYFDRLNNIYGEPITGNGQRALHISDNGNVYVGQKGLGLYEYQRYGDSLEIAIYNDTNSVITGSEELPLDYEKGDEVDLFTEASEIKTGRDNVVWIVNNGGNFPGYTLIAKDGENFYGFAEYPLDACSGQNSRAYFHIEIDDEGTKWLGSDQSSISSGILLYNENGTLEDESDDLCMTIKTSSVRDLPNNRITALVKDKNGWIWVGTPTGVAYFLNPSAIKFSDDPEDLIGVTAQIFDGINVRDIKVDAVNNKWIATNTEIKVFDPDGTQLLLTINSNNSPLPSSGITALHIIEDSGEVLIGTQTGMFRVKTLNSTPLEAYDIDIYPQPFNPNIHDKIRFDGLAANSELRIVKPNGEFVYSFNADGREAVWNGRKNNGNFVDDGVYLVITGSEKNGARSVAKFAVVKK